MRYRSIISFVGFTIITILFFYCAFKMTDKSGSYEPKIHSVVFEVNDGYGYLILNGDKLLIKQDFIPAIEGKKPFSSSNDAKLVANLVKDKLLNGNSPVVEIQELYSLDITILEK